MQKKLIFSLCFLLTLSTAFLFAQETVTIKGHVLEKSNGNPVLGAHVFLKQSKEGCITDQHGVFEIKNVKEGAYTLAVSFVGFEYSEMSIQAMKGMTEPEFLLIKQITEIDNVEIIGNAQRKTEEALKLKAPLKDIPITTSSVNKELLSQTQTSNINDALNYATGINPTVNYGGFQTFNMRGFRGPVIMVDGARDERMNFSNSAPVTSLAAVQSIEYLKGPASVLYGHSAVGGILNIVRNKPSDVFTANMQASYGSWQNKEVILGSGGKLSEKVNYRFDIGLTDNNGWRANSTKYFNGYAAIDYQLNEKNKLEFRLGGNDDLYATETGLPAVTKDIYNLDGTLAYQTGELPSNFKRQTRYNDPSDFLKHENWNASIKYLHEFNPTTGIQFHASYAHDIIDYFSTEELSYLTSSDEIYNNYYMNDEERVYISLDTLQRTYPFRFSHHTNTYQNYLDFYTQTNTGNIKHKIMAGYYFMYVDRTTYTGYNLGEDVSGPGLFAKIAVVDPIVNQGDLQTKFSGARNYDEMINSVYVQDLIDISDKLKALAALRFDYYHMVYQTGVVTNGLNQDTLSEKYTLTTPAVTYRAGLVYQPISSLSIYASYANFFQPNRRVYNGDYVYINSDGEEFNPEEGKQFFDPKKGYQIEGGLKFSLNHSLHVNASVFYIEQNNIIEYLGRTDDDRRIYGQVGVIGSNGVEIEVVTTPLEGFRLIGGYGYTDAKYLEFSSNRYLENPNEGNNVRQSPKNKVYSWMYYSLPRGVFKNFNVGVGFNYKDKIYTNTSNTLVLPSYWVMDATVGYSIKKVYLKFGMYNLLDKEYYSNYVYSNQYIPAPGRNYKFTIGIKI